MGCPLCKLEKKTEWLYEDDKLVVLVCQTCGVPMMVLREHKAMASPEDMLYMEKVREGRFPEWRWRGVGMRQVTNHYHWHLVRKER